MTVYDLWLPIILAGLATHVLSTIAWMALPHHKPEWQKLDEESDFRSFITKQSIPPGQYIFPFRDNGKDGGGASKGDAEGKCEGMLVLWKSPLNMGAAIGQTLGFFLVAAFVIGYLASLGLKPGASFMTVFQFVTTAGLLTHCAARFPNIFWFRRKIAMDMLDGIAFALATGAIFAGLWPAAA